MCVWLLWLNVMCARCIPVAACSDIWAVSADICGCHNLQRAVPLASQGWDQGCYTSYSSQDSPTTELTLPQVSVVPTLRRPGVDQAENLGFLFSDQLGPAKLLSKVGVPSFSVNACILFWPRGHVSSSQFPVISFTSFPIFGHYTSAKIRILSQSI